MAVPEQNRPFVAVPNRARPLVSVVPRDGASAVPAAFPAKAPHGT